MLIVSVVFGCGTDGTSPGPEGAAGQTWYEDADGDGFGDPSRGSEGDAGPSQVANGDDCDDTSPSIHPDAAELCNGVDDDCDGAFDDADPSVDPSELETFWADADGDGLGDPDHTVQACVQPAGAVSNDDDCTDAAPPGLDWANGIDDDCDGTVDSQNAAAPLGWTSTGLTPGGLTDADLDGDGDSDLVVPAYQNRSTILGWVDLVQIPAGTFADATWNVDTAWGVEVLAVDDLDGEGGDDLLIGGPLYTPQGWSDGWALGTMSGTPQSGASVDDNLLAQVRCEFRCVAGRPADFDGDGSTEVPVLDHRSASYELRLLSELPASGGEIALGDVPTEQVAPWPLAAYGGLIAADLNNDGYDDLVTVTFGVLSVNPGPDVADPSAAIVFEGLNGDADVGDVNGDGYPDLVVSSDRVGMQGVAVWYGGATLGWDIDRPDVVFEGLDRAVATGDVDGDGYDDIAALAYDTVAAVVRGGPALPAVIADVDLWVEAFPGITDVHLADVDGDGRHDLIVAYAGYTNGVSVFLGTPVVE